MLQEKLLEILHFSDIHPYDIQKIIDNFDNQQQEIARLNKIIDELEQYLKDKLYSYEPSPNLDKAIENYTYSKILDLLHYIKEEVDAND